jgi:hypothetical protein
VDGYFVVAGAPAPRPTRSRGNRRLLVAGLCALLGLTAAVGVVRLDRARAAADLAPLRVLTEPAPAEDGWGPTYVDDRGRPARWDPCRPIHYVVHTGWLPPTGRADLVEALRRLSRASGLVFVDDGDTDELPTRERAAYQPQRYGERWAPLLVAWVPEGATDLGLGPGVQGMTVGLTIAGADGGSIVSGQVALNASRPIPGGFGGGKTDGEVLLHELAHAVGLRHVLDPTQVMYPRTTNFESQYGAGDRAGLAALGRPAGCHPAPAPRA